MDSIRHRGARDLISSEPPRVRVGLDTLLGGYQIIGFDWQYLYVNATAVRHSRRKRHEFVGRRLMDVFPGIERTPLFRNLRRCMLTRRLIRTETKFTFTNGSHGFFDLTIQPVPEGILVLSMDITAQKEAHDKLKRTLAMLERAQEIAHVGSYELTIDAAEPWSSETLRIAGAKPGSRLMLRDYISEIVHPGDRDYVKHSFVRAYKNRTRYDTEYRIVRPNGAVRYVHSIAEPIRPFKNGKVKYVGATQDITQRRKLERELLKSSDHEKSRIGHDLHDGLCQVLAGIEFRLVELQYASKQYSDHCASELAKLARMVRDAISETRAIAHGLSPIKVGTDGLSSALKQLAEATAENFKVRCDFKCPAPIAIHDNTTGTHLYRIAQESIQNAIRHGKAKRIVLALCREQDRIVLGIKDDGVGIHSPNSRRTGIGLRLMQYRARLIHGSLVVHHMPHGGSEVVCSLHCSSEPATNRAVKSRGKGKS